MENIILIFFFKVQSKSFFPDSDSLIYKLKSYKGRQWFILILLKTFFLRNDGVKKLVSPKTDKQICPKQNSNNKK